MKRNFLHAFCTIMALSTLVYCSSTVAFAAEARESISNNYVTENSLKSTLYLNDWVDFSYGTSIKSLSTTMSAGSYTLYYSVSQPTTFILWSNDYTVYSKTLTGSGSISFSISSRCTHWQCTSNYANVSASFTIE